MTSRQEFLNEVYRRQYLAWGVRVSNVQITAAHVAEGLMLLLSAAAEAKVSAAPSADPDGLDKVFVEQLSAAWSGLDLSDAARALCITKSKHGPFSLSPNLETAVPPDEPRFRATRRDLARVEEAGREHVERTLSGRARAVPREVHDLISRVLNADGKVAIAGANTPTTPGPAFIGYDSNYSLRLLHAPTFLGLLAASDGGPQLVQRLARAVTGREDPHSRLVAELKLDRPRPSLESVALPYPSAAPWAELARYVGGHVRRLLDWNAEGSLSPPKADLLMSLTDLVGLFFTARMLRWPDGTVDEVPVLLVAPNEARSRSAARVQDAARHCVQRALGRLGENAPYKPDPTSWWATFPWDPRSPNGKSHHDPTVAARKLGAASGWLLPRFAQGGARRYFAPGPRQLKTLVHALVEPTESLKWADFHERVETQLGLCLGGHDPVRISRRRSAGVVTAGLLRTAGQLTQRRLIDLGLARREADNVVVVDGGAR